MKGRVAHPGAPGLRSTTDGESEQRIVKGKNSHAKIPASRDKEERGRQSHLGQYYWRILGADESKE